MKRILALALVLAMFTLALASCGSDGDTNMHKIMGAVNDGVITRDDEYVFKSMEGYQSTDNEDYSEVIAFCNGVNPNKLVGFNAGNVIAIKDTSKNSTDLNITWWAKDSETTYNGQTASIPANTISMEVEYTTRYWDSTRSEWMTETTSSALIYGISMDDYYQNGSFTSEGTTTIGNVTCIDPGFELLNDAFNGLNGIFTDKGYPIK